MGYYGRITMEGPTDGATRHRDDLAAPGASTLQNHREVAVAAARRVLVGVFRSDDPAVIAEYLLRTLGLPRS